MSDPKPPLRTKRENEICAYETADRQTIISIVENGSGAYLVFKSTLLFDKDEGLYYWSDQANPFQGIFGSVETALREAEVELGEELTEI